MEQKLFRCNIILVVMGRSPRCFDWSTHLKCCGKRSLSGVSGGLTDI